MASTTTIDWTNAELDAALQMMEVRASMAKARVERLCAGAFENAPRALHTLNVLLRKNGPEGAINALSETRQQWFFGFQRKAFLGFFASRDPDVKRALADLPEAIRELAESQDRLRDLQQAYRQHHQSRPREPREHSQGQDLVRERSRSRT